jgi:hypothetical protein
VRSAGDGRGNFVHSVVRHEEPFRRLFDGFEQGVEGLVVVIWWASSMKIL